MLKKKSSYAQSDLILQFLVNRVANLLVLHICGVHLENVNKTQRTKLIDATSTKQFIKFMFDPSFSYEEGATLADGLFRIIQNSDLDLTEDLEAWLKADTKERNTIFKDKKISQRKRDQMKFLTKAHKQMSKEIYTNFNKVMGTLRKNDIRVVSGLPADEYILGKILDSVTRGSYEVSEIMAQEFVDSTSGKHNVLGKGIKEEILRKYRYRGKDNIFGIVYVYYNNKRIGVKRSPKFKSKSALFQNMVDDAKYFNGKIKNYAKFALGRYIDNAYVNEELQEIADNEERYEGLESNKTEALLDLIDSDRDSANAVKDFYKENKQTLEEDYAYADFDTRKEILQARQGLLNNVIKGLKHGDLSKKSLQYTVKNILSNVEVNLAGIDPAFKRILEKQLTILSEYDWDGWDGTNMFFDPQNIDESDITEDITFAGLHETLQEVFITQPNADPLITELMNNLKNVQSWDKTNAETLKEQIGTLKEMLETHSNILGGNYDYLKQAILKRRVKEGDLDADEFLDLNDGDRYEYINAIENNFVRDFGVGETSLYNYVLDAVAGVTEGDSSVLEEFDKFSKLKKSKPDKYNTVFETLASKIALKISSKEIKTVNKKEYLSKRALKQLAEKEIWDKSKDSVPMDKASMTPADTIKEIVTSIDSSTPQNQIKGIVELVLGKQRNKNILFFNDKISEKSSQKEIGTILGNADIKALKLWYRNRLDLLDEIKKDLIKNKSKSITSEDNAYNAEAEKALSDALGEGVISLLEKLETTVLENKINSLTLKNDEKDVLRQHLKNALKGRALWLASSPMEKETYQLSDREEYEDKKEELKEAREKSYQELVSLHKKDFPKKMITNEDEYFEEIISGLEDLDSTSSDDLYSKLLEHRSYLYNGTSGLAEKTKALGKKLKARKDSIKIKYENEDQEEIQIEVGAKNFNTKKESVKKHLGDLVSLHLKDEDLTWKEKRKKQYFRSQTIRKALKGAIEHSITDDYGQSITQILKKLNIYDMSHENLMEIVEDKGLAKCFPSAQPLQEDNYVRLIKVYFLAVENSLEVFFNKSTRQYKSSSLKFPNDFLSADLGSKLFEQFLLGIRGKYSWQFRDHLEFWGLDMESEEHRDPTGLPFEEDNQLNEANTDVGKTGFIPSSFWDKVGLSDIPELLENLDYEGTVSISDDGSHVIEFTDMLSDASIYSYDPVQLEKELKEHMISAFAKDFKVEENYAELILKEVMSSSVGLGRESKTNILNFLRGASFDLTYLASAWALELLQNQKTMVDSDFSIECFEFMDQLSTLAQKEEAQKVLLHEMKEQQKRSNKKFKNKLDPKDILGDLLG